MQANKWLPVNTDSLYNSDAYPNIDRIQLTRL